MGYPVANRSSRECERGLVIDASQHQKPILAGLLWRVEGQACEVVGSVAPFVQDFLLLVPIVWVGCVRIDHLLQDKQAKLAADEDGEDKCRDDRSDERIDIDDWLKQGAQGLLVDGERDQDCGRKGQAQDCRYADEQERKGVFAQRRGIFDRDFSV